MHKYKISQTVKVLSPLLCAYPSARITDDTIRIYALALGELPAEQLQGGVLRCLRTCKFFPTIAEISDAAQTVAHAAAGTGMKNGDEAWKELEKLKYSTLFHQTAVASTPELQAAIDTMGWQTLRDPELKDLPTIRAQFLRVYEAICARGRNDQINSHVLRMMKGGPSATDGLIHQIANARDMNS